MRWNDEYGQSLTRVTNPCLTGYGEEEAAPGNEVTAIVGHVDMPA
jgi:hypothetical protein